MSDEDYERVYNALCKKINCDKIVVGKGNFIKAIHHNYYNRHFIFWINDSYDHLKINKKFYKFTKKDIVLRIFEVLKKNFIVVHDIKLPCGLTMESLMIEADLNNR